MTQEERLVQLKSLKQAGNQIIDKILEAGEAISGAINWGDLGCTEARYVLTEEGREFLEVVVQEASPEASFLQGVVAARLKELGWPDVSVVTEW